MHACAERSVRAALSERIGANPVARTWEVPAASASRSVASILSATSNNQGYPRAAVIANWFRSSNRRFIQGDYEGQDLPRARFAYRLIDYVLHRVGHAKDTLNETQFDCLCLLWLFWAVNLL